MVTKEFTVHQEECLASKKEVKEDQLTYFPKEAVFIGQWDPAAALPNNDLPFEPRMIDKKGIIETAVKKCRPIADELPSTHS